MVDVETEGGIEFGAVILGPAYSEAADQMRVRFNDGLEDDWPLEDFRTPAGM